MICQVHQAGFPGDRPSPKHKKYAKYSISYPYPTIQSPGDTPWEEKPETAPAESDLRLTSQSFCQIYLDRRDRP